MTAIEASPVSLSESGLVKMEDRKRPAAYDHNDSAPPLKKQATSLNGGGKPHPDTDMPWKDDLEVSQRCCHIAKAARVAWKWEFTNVQY